MRRVPTFYTVQTSEQQDYFKQITRFGTGMRENLTDIAPVTSAAAEQPFIRPQTVRVGLVRVIRIRIVLAFELSLRRFIINAECNGIVPSIPQCSHCLLQDSEEHNAERQRQFMTVARFDTLAIKRR